MSHTDSRGNDQYNNHLSQKRAESVVNYLSLNGIPSARIVARGYGESRLRNNCNDNEDCTEKEHQYNRRTEFRITNINNAININYTDAGPSIISKANFSNKRPNNTARKSSHEQLDLSAINDRLNNSGTYLITVGALSNPHKKANKMSEMGFSKTTTREIPHKPGVFSVIVGGVDDLDLAKQIRQSLLDAGIRNSILKEE